MTGVQTCALPISVLALLKVTGDWQKFKGLPGAEGTLKVREPKGDKNAAFAATVLAVANEPRTPTIRPKVEKPVVVEEPVAEEAPAVEAEVEATEAATDEAVETVVEAVDAAVEGTEEA